MSPLTNKAMSNYSKQAKHPETGEWQEAEFLDDYYGRHQYGVRFPDGSVFREEDVVTPVDPLKEPL